ncbi:hypothetical protein LCGC14_1351380 [marine sediment metagenome]|uniref:Reverse transcriptase domain-containing protein n=1 Tax=marine sediment metagenome TaxID=412755 RepID=A0A0F9KAV4_9ZZZZ
MSNLKKFYKKKDWWIRVNWSELRSEIGRMQENIYQSSKIGDIKMVNNLMKSLVKSREAKLLAIYNITQKNRGRNTAGVDGLTYLTPKERMKLSKKSFNYKKYKFQPVIKRFIPKKTYKKDKRMRALGILTLKDRVMAKIISFALMAKWDPIFESNVIGYRPGRSRQEAIYTIGNILSKGNKVVLEADIKNFFENIEHRIILEKIGLFKSIIKKILKIKIIENEKRYRNKKGIVQGNPLSPVLANIALHGLQDLFETQIINGKYVKANAKVGCVRYADDFIIIAPSYKLIETWVIPRLEKFLNDRGLMLNKDKTKITTMTEGFQFLGYFFKQIDDRIMVKSIKKGYTHVPSILIN